MKKYQYLFILALFMFLASLVEAISGFVLWFAIPRGGGRQGLEQVFWGMSRDGWVDWHDWAAVALLALLIVHIILHWKWISRMFRTCCPGLRPK